jgi:hypothetical protein
MTVIIVFRHCLEKSTPALEPKEIAKRQEALRSLCEEMEHPSEYIV